MASAVLDLLADHIGRKSPDISHPLSMLEDARLITREADPFRKGRSAYYVRRLRGVPKGTRDS